jgi:hypothetical protein
VGRVFRLTWRFDQLDVVTQRAAADHSDNAYGSLIVTVGDDARTWPASGDAVRLGGILHSGDTVALGPVTLGPFLVLPDSPVMLTVTATNMADIESPAEQLQTATAFVRKVNDTVIAVAALSAPVFALAGLVLPGAILIPAAVAVTGAVIGIVDDVVEGIAGKFKPVKCNGTVFSLFNTRAGDEWLFAARAGTAVLADTGYQLTSPSGCGAPPVYRLRHAVTLEPTPSAGDGAAAAPLAGTLSVFWAGASGQVRSTVWDSSTSPVRWSAPADVSGLGAAQPGLVTALTPYFDSVSVFWVGPAGQVSQASGEPYDAQIWGRLPDVAPAGSAASGPVAAVDRHRDRWDLFWVGPQGQIRSAFFDQRVKAVGWTDIPATPGWNQPFDVAPAGSAAPGAVKAVARHIEHLDVFWIGPQGQLRSTWWDNGLEDGRWQAAFDIAGPGSAQPGAVTAVARQIEHLDVFWVGPQGQVRSTAWDSGQADARWLAPFDIAGPGSAQPGGICCVARNPGHLDVFWVGPQGQVRSTSWDSVLGDARWQIPFDVAPAGSARAGSLSAVARDAEHLDLFWTGPAGQVQSASWGSDVNDARWRAPFDITPARAVDLGTITGFTQRMLALSAQLSAGSQHRDAAMVARIAAQALADQEVPPEDAAATAALQASALRASLTEAAAAGDAAGVDAVTADTVAAYRRAAAVPDADVLGISGDLTALERQLSANPATAAGALLAAQAAVDVLRAFQPPDGERATYLTQLAEMVHNLAFRLRDVGRPDDAAAAARQAVAAYQAAAAAPGADVLGIVAQLPILSKFFLSLGLKADGFDAQQAAVDLLRGFQPGDMQRTAYLTQLAEMLHNLAFRLADVDRPDDAAATARQAVTAYQAAAAASGADIPGIAAQLQILAQFFDSLGLNADALATQQAAVALTPSGQR